MPQNQTRSTAQSVAAPAPKDDGGDAPESIQPMRSSSAKTARNQDPDRRRHSRINYRLKARYLSVDGNERPCVVVNISAGGALVRAKVTPKIGEKVVLYVDGVGRFESLVTRSGRHAFALKYSSRRSKTKRTADALIRILNRGQQLPDRRLTPRIEMNQSVRLTHEDGSVTDCSIQDVSLTGASLEMDNPPALGTEMIVGRMKARVVRRHESGVGVVFTGSSKHMDDVIAQTGAKFDEDEEPGDKSSSVLTGKEFASPPLRKKN